MGTPRQKKITIAVLIVTVLLVAFLLAQGTTRLAAAKLLPIDRTTADAAPTKRRASASTEIARADSTGILRRNIFDSETGPLDGSAVVDEPVEEVLDTPTTDTYDGGAVATCDGSMRLVAAVTNPRRPEWSFAAIIGAAGKAMLYRSGQEVDGREIVQVRSRTVIMRPSGGSYCQIAMFDEEVTAPTAMAAVMTATKMTKAPRRPAREGAISSADMDSGITRVSDTEFTVQRSLVDQILENQGELMRTARIIPHEEGGRVVGVKMYGIRRNSLLGRLGLQNGDMLRTINGFDMSSPDSALEAYTRLRSADHLTLSIVRRGQGSSVNYNIQ